MLNFGNMHISGISRVFSRGFLTIYGEEKESGKKLLLPNVPQLIIDGQSNYDPKRCSIVEDRPEFVLSNDDIGNLGHYINDVGMIWNMGVLANRPFNQSVLLNIDGIRSGGPAGGVAHRLMHANSPDGNLTILYFTF
jgi:hypothetical protein